MRSANTIHIQTQVDKELWYLYREAIRREDEMLLDQVISKLEEKYGIEIVLTPRTELQEDDR